MSMVIAGDTAGAFLAEQLGMAIDIKQEWMQDAELYPDLAARISRQVVDGIYSRAVLICGTGIGMSIAANKVPGISAALVHDCYSAERAALSNNANIITMGARVIGPELALRIVKTWMSYGFDPSGPSAANVRAVNALETRLLRG